MEDAEADEEVVLLVLLLEEDPDQADHVAGSVDLVVDLVPDAEVDHSDQV